MPPSRPSPSAEGRIAVVAHAHPSVSKGGAEIAAYSLYQGLRALNRDAIFVAACADSLADRLVLASDSEFVVPFDSSRYEHFYQLSPPAVCRRLTQILRSQEVRTASFHHFFNLGLNAIRSVALETEIEILVTFHEYLAICHHHGQMVTRPARRLCEKASAAACNACFPAYTLAQFELRRDLMLSSLSYASGFISPSKFLANRMAAWGLPKEKIAVIENGLPYGPQRDGGDARVEGQRWVFGYFGQINPFKGVDVLLEACEILSGSGDFAERLELRLHGGLVGLDEAFENRFDAALREHPFLRHMGPYDNADVGALMGRCDYVLIPSTWWENSPVVIQEAYAAGKPVLCSGIGGLAEKVQDRVTGLHFRVGHAGDLVRALKLAADPGMFDQLTRNLPDPLNKEEMAEAYLRAMARFRHAETLSPRVREAAPSASGAR